MKIKQTTCRLFSIILFGALILFSGLNSASAAVVVDSAGNSAAFNVAGVSTLTWTQTVGTRTSRALFVGVSTASTTVPSAVARVTSVTFGAQTLTRVANGFQASPDLNNAVELFILVNPTSGTNTITVNLTPLGANYVVGGSIAFTGVNQTTPTGAFVSTTNALNAPTNTATINVADSVVGDMVLDVIGTSFNAQNLLPNAAQTRQWRLIDDTPTAPPPFYVGAGSTKAGASGAVTMSWSLQFAQNWALGAIAVKAAPPATAAEVIISGRVTTANNKSISRAVVTIIDGSGAARRTMTNPSGYYRFLNVPTGATYIFEARSKHNTFNSQVVSVTEESNAVNFTANP